MHWQTGSCRPKAPEDPSDEDDGDDWIDNAYAFGVECLNGPIIGSSHNNINDHLSNCPSTDDDTMLKVLMLNQEVLKIPILDKSVKRDKQIAEIKRFLEEPERRADLTEQEFHQFMNSS